MTTEDILKIKQAYAYAEKMHSGQKRKGGEPYIIHPAAVADYVYCKGCGRDYVITALFHDLLEDTAATESEIERLGGKNVLEAVKLLTKGKNYNPDEYIKGVKSNKIAFAVKNADRLNNVNSAYCCSEEFKRRYAEETIDYYLDFSPEMPLAVKKLVNSLIAPLDEKRIKKLEAALKKTADQKQ